MRQTNQRAEITAVIRALQATHAGEPLEIRTDSQYTIKALTAWITAWRRSGFKDVQNADLFREADALLSARVGTVDFVRFSHRPC